MKSYEATNPIAALTQSQGHYLLHALSFFIILLATDELKTILDPRCFTEIS
jgi:hypothetical protein